MTRTTMPQPTSRPLWQRVLLTLCLMSGALFLLNAAAGPPALSIESIDAAVKVDASSSYGGPSSQGVFSSTIRVEDGTADLSDDDDDYNDDDDDDDNEESRTHTTGLQATTGPYLPQAVGNMDESPTNPLPATTTTTIGLLRLVGNPIPQFYDADHVLQNIRFVLSHPLPNTNTLHTHWCLYRIADTAWQARVLNLLDRNNQTYTILEDFNRTTYARIPSSFQFYDNYRGDPDAVHSRYRRKFGASKETTLQGMVRHEKLGYVYNANVARNAMLEWAAVHWKERDADSTDTDDTVVDWWIPTDSATLLLPSVVEHLQRYLHSHTPTTSTVSGDKTATSPYVVLPIRRVNASNAEALDVAILEEPGPLASQQLANNNDPTAAYFAQTQLPLDYQIVLHRTALARYHPHLRVGRYDETELLSRLQVDGYGWWNVHADGEWLPWEIELLQATRQEPELRVADDPWRLSLQAPPSDLPKETRVPLVSAAPLVRLYSHESKVRGRGQSLRDMNDAVMHQQMDGMVDTLLSLDLQVAKDDHGYKYVSHYLFYDRSLLQYERKLYQQAQFQPVDEMSKRIQSLVWMIYRLTEVARESHRHGPWSVTDKPPGFGAPSGDPHDYYNVVNNLHPPVLDDGSLGFTLPYVKGHRISASHLFAERSERYDASRFAALSYNVTVLSLASFFTGQEVYGQYAVKMLKVWFWDPGTKMNPHLDFSAVRMNHNQTEWRGENVADFKHVYFLLDAVRLLEEKHYLKPRQSKLFRQWMTKFLKWFESSEMAQWASTERDENAVWYDIIAASISYFLKRERKALQYFQLAESRLRSHFDDSFEMPAASAVLLCEDAQMKLLYAWQVLARMSNTMGVDLWHKGTSHLREGVPMVQQVIPADDPNYDPSASDGYAVLCASSARAIPYAIDRPICNSKGDNKRMDPQRWWPLLDGYRRECPDMPVENPDGSSWMREADRPPNGRYHMPFLYPPEYGIAPFWNLGYRIMSPPKAATATTAATEGNN